MKGALGKEPCGLPAGHVPVWVFIATAARLEYKMGATSRYAYTLVDDRQYNV